MSNPASIYKKSSLDSKILGESPHGLIRLLFEKLEKSLSEAKDLMSDNALSENKIAAAIKVSETLRLSTNIVQALADSLVKDEGDTGLFDQLSYLYAHIQHQILLASMNFEVEPVDQSLRIVQELSGAWREIPNELHDVTSK